MTISSSVNKSGPYPGNGVTTVFPRMFRALDESHIRVFQIEGGISSEVFSGFTKDGIGDDTGSVTFDAAPAVGVDVLILRAVPLTQETDYSEQGKVSPVQVEDDLDLQEMQIQDLNERIDRAYSAPVFGKSFVAGNVPKFDENGNLVDSEASATELLQVSQSAIDSALLSQAWAESPTAPGAPGTKSAKTHASDAAASAVEAALYGGPRYATVAEMVAEAASFPVGKIMQGGAYIYQRVASGAHLTLASGEGVKVLTKDADGFYPADAWGSDNAAFIAAAQSVGKVYLGPEQRTINVGTAGAPLPMNRLEVKGGDVVTDGWYPTFVGQPDRRFALHNVKFDQGPSAVLGAAIVMTRGAESPTVIGCEFLNAKDAAIAHVNHTGFPRNNGNRIINTGTDRKMVGVVRYGCGIILRNGPVGEILNNFMEDVWQIPIFVLGDETPVGVVIDGGLIAFNKIYGAMDNGIRTQPYGNDEAGAAAIRNVKILYNDLRGVNIDAIRHNGTCIDVIGNTYRDWTSSRHGLIEATTVFKGDNAIDCRVMNNTGEDVPSLGGMRLEIAGAVAKRIHYSGNVHRGPNTQLGSIRHVVLNEACYFEDLTHTDNDLEGAWHGIHVTGINPARWAAGTYTTGTKVAYNGTVYRVTASPSTAATPAVGPDWAVVGKVSRGVTINGGRHIGLLRSGFDGEDFDDLTINGGEFVSSGGFNGIQIKGNINGKSVVRPDRVTTETGAGAQSGAAAFNVTTYPFVYRTAGAAAAYVNVGGVTNRLIADVSAQTAVTALPVTATTGTLPTPNNAVVIANAATPTVVELLDLSMELRAKVDAMNAALLAAGVTK